MKTCMPRGKQLAKTVKMFSKKFLKLLARVMKVSIVQTIRRELLHASTALIGSSGQTLMSIHVFTKSDFISIKKSLINPSQSLSFHGKLARLRTFYLALCLHLRKQKAEIVCFRLRGVLQKFLEQI